MHVAVGLGFIKGRGAQLNCRRADVRRPALVCICTMGMRSKGELPVQRPMRKFPQRELKARSVKPDFPEDSGLRSIVPTATKLALLGGTSIWRAWWLVAMTIFCLAVDASLAQLAERALY